MKRAYLLVSNLILAVLVMPGITFAGGNSPVEYTWTLAALGQGGWVGGPLYADGTSGGGGAISMNNGQFVARIIPTTWTEPSEDVLSICFNVVPIKPAQAPSSSTCIPADVTGTPTHVTLFGEEHILRVTEVN
jgi:hypothetical protein